MLWRALLAFLALPGVVAIALPAWFAADALRNGGRFHAVGLLPLVAGLTLLLWCVRDFYVAGKGTLAPWSPPKHLVTTGLYRYSRNPMYVAVTTMLLGWALAFASPRLADLCRHRGHRVPPARGVRRGALARAHAWRGLGRVPCPRAALAAVSAQIG